MRELVDAVLQEIPGKWELVPQEKHLPEAPLLSLAIDKAKETLGWQPRWDFSETIRQTVAWYREDFERDKTTGTTSMIEFTQKQIAAYTGTLA